MSAYGRNLETPKLIANKVNWAIRRESGVLPVSKMTKAAIPAVASSSKGLLQEESDLLTVCISDEFDSDTYNLREDSGYDFSKPASPGHIVDANPYGPNDTQKRVQKQGDGVVTPRIGLGCMPSHSEKISRWRKDKRLLTQYVMVEATGNDKGDNATSNPKSSVFDRLQPLHHNKRPFAFNRMTKNKATKPSMF